MSMIVTRNKDDFLSNLGRIMDDPDFRKFFDQNFNEWGDIKAIIMLMKAYSLIDEHASDITGQKLAPEKIVEILRFTMNNRELRSVLVDGMDDFIKGRYDFSTRFKQLTQSQLKDK